MSDLLRNLQKKLKSELADAKFEMKEYSKRAGGRSAADLSRKRPDLQDKGFKAKDYFDAGRRYDRLVEKLGKVNKRLKNNQAVSNSYRMEKPKKGMGGAGFGGAGNFGSRKIKKD